MHTEFYSLNGISIMESVALRSGVLLHASPWGGSVLRKSLVFFPPFALMSFSLELFSNHLLFPFPVFRVEKTWCFSSFKDRFIALGVVIHAFKSSTGRRRWVNQSQFVLHIVSSRLSRVT